MASSRGSGMKQPKVILFCPVREKAEIRKHSLDAHRKLTGVSERWYFDDRGDTAIRPLIEECSATRMLWVPNLPADADYQQHNWTPGAVSRVAAIKDAAIRAFLETDADALFLIDADVIPHPDLVWHLLSLDLPIVSEVYWTQWPNMPPVYMPQVWDYHGYGFHSPENLIRLKGPGVFEVGGLGACTLIRRETLMRMVGFPAPLSSA